MSLQETGGTARCNGSQDSTDSRARQARRGLPWEEEDGPSRVRTEGGVCHGQRGAHVCRSQGRPPASEPLCLCRSCWPSALVGPRGRHTRRRDATVGQGNRATSRSGTTGSRGPQRPWPWRFFSCAQRLVQHGSGADGQNAYAFCPPLTAGVRLPSRSCLL
jgi:hypothetical protein